VCVDVAVDAVGRRFAGGSDGVMVVWGGDGPGSGAEAPREKVVPRGVAEMGEGGVADECYFEGPVGLSSW
jgi:hypothetical protein